MLASYNRRIQAVCGFPRLGLSQDCRGLSMDFGEDLECSGAMEERFFIFFRLSMGVF